MKYRVMQILFAMVIVFGAVVSVYGAVKNAETDQFIKEVDELLEEYENSEPSIEEDARSLNMAPAAPEYSWKEQLLAKIVGFECGFCCNACKHACASACINRMNNWYDGDPVAMVTDGNDEYYMMNPVYAELDCIEVNGWNYFEHAEEMLQIVKEAENRTANIWYWDCDDTQREWADVVWHCPEDGMWYYR